MSNRCWEHLTAYALCVDTLHSQYRAHSELMGVSLVGRCVRLVWDYLVYTLSEARSGVDWADLMAAQGAFGTDCYDKSTRTILGTML